MTGRAFVSVAGGYGNRASRARDRRCCDVWAVGQTEDPGQLTLIEHWNGKAWRRVTSPNPGSNNKLNDVSPSWAVGSYNSSGTKTLVLRRVGNSWAWVTSPNPETNLNELQGVVQISPNNAWAAGYVLNGTAYRTLILHWNGTAWKRVQSPNTGVDVDIDSMHARAVGSYTVGSSLKGFILRRDGTNEAGATP